MILENVFEFLDNHIQKGGFKEIKEKYLNKSCYDNIEDDAPEVYDNEDGFLYLGAFHDGECSDTDEGYMRLNYISVEKQKEISKKVNLTDFINKVNNAEIIEESYLYYRYYWIYKSEFKKIRESIFSKLSPDISEKWIRAFLITLNEKVDDYIKIVDNSDFEILNDCEQRVNLIKTSLENFKDAMRSLLSDDLKNNSSSTGTVIQQTYLINKLLEIADCKSNNVSKAQFISFLTGKNAQNIREALGKTKLSTHDQVEITNQFSSLSLLSHPKISDDVDLKQKM